MDPSKLRKGGLEQTDDKNEIEKDQSQNKKSWQEHEAALMLTSLSDKGSGSSPQEDASGSNDKQDDVKVSCQVASSTAATKENGENCSDITYTSAYATTAAQNASLGELAASIAAHHGIMTHSQPHSDAVTQPQPTYQTKSADTLPSAATTDNQRPCVQWTGAVKTFPEKLHDILESEHEKENESEKAMCWLPNGLSFVITNRQKLLTEVLPRHQFEKCKKFGSFTRRLYLWGFRKIANGPDAGAFFHEMFQRGNRAACREMRKTLKIAEGMTISAASSIDQKPVHASSRDLNSQARKVTDSSTLENVVNGNRMSGDSDSDDDENDDDQDYYDRQILGPLQTLHSAPNLHYVGNGGAKGRETHALNPMSVSLSYDGSAYPPEIQALVDKVDASSLSLNSLIGVHHTADESPAMMHLYHAASTNNFDRDALTEWLLFHHQKKLFLRTALLSDMVRTLAAQKGYNGMDHGMNGEERYYGTAKSAVFPSPTETPATLPQLQMPPQQRHPKQAKLNHEIVPAPAHYIPKQPKNRKPKAKDKISTNLSKKETKKTKPFISSSNGKA